MFLGHCDTCQPGFHRAPITGGLNHWTVRGKSGFSPEWLLQLLKLRCYLCPLTSPTEASLQLKRHKARDRASYLVSEGKWGRLSERKAVHSFCHLSTSLRGPPASPWLGAPLSHTCWQSVLTCAAPGCTEAWLRKSRRIYFCRIHTYLVCSQMGVVFMSQFSSAKGKKYSGAINVDILKSHSHVLCI